MIKDETIEKITTMIQVVVLMIGVGYLIVRSLDPATSFYYDYKYHLVRLKIFLEYGPFDNPTELSHYPTFFQFPPAYLVIGKLISFIVPDSSKIFALENLLGILLGYIIIHYFIVNVFQKTKKEALKIFLLIFGNGYFIGYNIIFGRIGDYWGAILSLPYLFYGIYVCSKGLPKLKETFILGLLFGIGFLGYFFIPLIISIYIGMLFIFRYHNKINIPIVIKYLITGVMGALIITGWYLFPLVNTYNKYTVLDLTIYHISRSSRLFLSSIFTICWMILTVLIKLKNNKTKGLTIDEKAYVLFLIIITLVMIINSILKFQIIPFPLNQIWNWTYITSFIIISSLYFTENGYKKLVFISFGLIFLINTIYNAPPVNCDGYQEIEMIGNRINPSATYLMINRIPLKCGRTILEYTHPELTSSTSQTFEWNYYEIERYGKKLEEKRFNLSCEDLNYTLFNKYNITYLILPAPVNLSCPDLKNEFCGKYYCLYKINTQ